VSHRGAAAKSTAAVCHRGAATTAHMGATTAAAESSATAAVVLSRGCRRDCRRAQNRGGRNCDHVFAHHFTLPVHKNCARNR
jgi:hypothetical protein